MGNNIKKAYGYQRRDANRLVRVAIEEHLLLKALKASGPERAERLFGAKERAKQEAELRIPLDRDGPLGAGEIRHLKSTGELSSWTKHHKLSSTPEERTAALQSFSVAAASDVESVPEPEEMGELERMELFSETRRSIREELPPGQD